MYEHIISIDPGQSGAAAFLDAGSGDVLEVVQHQGDDTIVSFFKSFQDIKRTAVVLEAVHGSPLQGAQAAFRFGDNFGAWRLGAKSAGFPVFGITPQEWQKALTPALVKTRPANWDELSSSQKKTRHKAALRDIAAGLFPDEQVVLATADALLIGHYAINSQKTRGLLGGKLL